ncbi:unnamed protein product [Acanthosepion pharaonis]|uniref:Uncharacterized protein n=1 Tax=Acanthosepion pharaonis TaxID=158019 RepID=A0A812B6A3_ACAPH|nr:unnamed protein product [Sepia pharaonis]
MLFSFFLFFFNPFLSLDSFLFSIYSHLFTILVSEFLSLFFFPLFMVFFFLSSSPQYIILFLFSICFIFTYFSLFSVNKRMEERKKLFVFFTVFIICIQLFFFFSCYSFHSHSLSRTSLENCCFYSPFFESVFLPCFYLPPYSIRFQSLTLYLLSNFVNRIPIPLLCFHIIILSFFHVPFLSFFLFTHFLIPNLMFSPFFIERFYFPTSFFSSSFKFLSVNSSILILRQYRTKFSFFLFFSILFLFPYLSPISLRIFLLPATTDGQIAPLGQAQESRRPRRGVTIKSLRPDTRLRQAVKNVMGPKASIGTVRPARHPALTR